MTGAPIDATFRPPDPVTVMDKQNLHPSIQESSSGSSYNSSQVREEAIHTTMAEKELDGTRINFSMVDLHQMHDTRTVHKESLSQELPNSPKLQDFPSAINPQATATINTGESSQRCHQNLRPDAALRPEFATGDYNPGRGGHLAEVSSAFHGRIFGGDNSDVPTTPAINIGNFPHDEDMQFLAQTQHPHKEGKQQAQDLGQSSSSDMEDSIKKQGKDIGKLSTDKSLPPVFPASNVSENSGKDFYRSEHGQSKVWVPKEQGNPNDLRQVQGHLENDCSIRQRDEDKKKKEMENLRNKNNKDTGKNPQQPKGHKEDEQQEDNNQQYKQQRDQEQLQPQKEEHW
uniref:Uncharacterized protein n=1 Tax=Solanum tuberosum TaxID=4113 RepID=M1DH65_SOLTU